MFRSKKEKEEKSNYVFTKEDMINTFDRCVDMLQANSTMNYKERMELNYMKVNIKQNEEIIELLKQLNSK